MTTTGDEQTLKQLRDAVELDFSENVFVSHGLFSSPYPSGSHVFCEVDTSDVAETQLWSIGKLELVIRIFSRRRYVDASLPEELNNNSRVIEVLRALHGDVPVHPASFESLLQAVRDFHCRSFSLKMALERAGNNEATETATDALWKGVSHPNVVPLYGAFLGQDNLYLVFPPSPFSLKSVLHFSPDALGNDWQVRLLVYEILAGLAHLHRSGLRHGNLTASSVLLRESLWCSLTGFIGSGSADTGLGSADKQTDIILKHPAVLHPMDWKSQFKKWWEGELSNFDYLLLLNRLAGRRWGDRCFHTVMPWVIDFSTRPDEESDAGWRDLTKSKWRLAKGDEQLDFTYATAEIPHHVSDDCLSELAVCIYKARTLPLLVLRRVVRSVYEPNEYPSSMQRLFQWTPDECIPEFYSDPGSLRSTHSGMSDLAVPTWAKDAEDFIFQHRAALESERVSRQLHHWIDLIFGYKLSGEAAVAAKNVTLSTAGPTVPRSSGRRQLFFKPHPMRRSPSGQGFSSLEQLEEAVLFSESARHLSSWFPPGTEDVGDGEQMLSATHATSSGASQGLLLKLMNSDQALCDSLHKIIEPQLLDDVSYRSFSVWQVESRQPKPLKKALSDDIFAAGCLVAEIHLRKPLFDSTSGAAWSERGVLPGTIDHLSATARVLVEAALMKDYSRRPTAEMLLDSPYFPPEIRTAYTFLASFHFLPSNLDRLQYAARMAQASAFQLMGPIAAALCAPSCLSLLVSPADADPMASTLLLKSLLQILEPYQSKRLLMPVVKNILQGHDSPQLKSALLTSPFIRNLRRVIGTSLYLQHIHTPIVLNLRSPESQQGIAASAVLVDTCQELGLPVSLNQTVLPLMQSLGRDITSHGVDALVEIGRRFGDHAIIKHWLPPLRSIIMLGELTSSEKMAATQTWRLLAASDALTVMERLLQILSSTSLVPELLQETMAICMTILQQKAAPLNLLQSAANAVVVMCSQAGAEATSVHVMPQLKRLFDEFALDIEGTGGEDDKFFLVYAFYPALATLLGIEKLRKSLPTWLLLEQGLGKRFDWKWTGTKCLQKWSSGSLSLDEEKSAPISPANLLLHGIGWSIPQSRILSHGAAGHFRQGPDSVENGGGPQHSQLEEQWSWVPFQSDSCAGIESFGRIGAGHTLTKDEQSWRINAIAVHAWRAHNGNMKVSALGEDESTIYTGGGIRGKSTVRKWDFSTSKCIAEYVGHEEAIVDICCLPGFERVASCDGTIHIWNSETGRRIALLDETTVQYTSAEARMLVTGESGAVDATNGILSTANSYTLLHFMDAEKKMLAGTATGNLRFIDPAVGRQLYSWRCEHTEPSLSSFISSITSTAASWIAVSFTSGNCSLLDCRSGSVIGHWRAHTGAITKLLPLEDNYLVSSSMDKTLSVWDLRRGWPPCSQTFQGHTDGIASFALWGSNILSAAGNKIGVSSFSKLQNNSYQTVDPRRIYTSDRISRNLSRISTINVLPFSRQFIIGTEDGLLKFCT